MIDKNEYLIEAKRWYENSARTSKYLNPQIEVSNSGTVIFKKFVEEYYIEDIHFICKSSNEVVNAWTLNNHKLEGHPSECHLYIRIQSTNPDDQLKSICVNNLINHKWFMESLTKLKMQGKIQTYYRWIKVAEWRKHRKLIYNVPKNVLASRYTINKNSKIYKYAEIKA